MTKSIFIQKKTQFIAFLILLFLSSVVYSQTNVEVFERITIKDGLSNSSVNYIIQDKQGFMWFATYGGINKYDGYTFKVYKNIPNDKTSLSINETILLFEDSDGYIWVVNNANSGVDKFDPITESFTNYKHDPNDSTSISSNEIYSVMQDKLGNIWVCTKNALNLVVNENKGDHIKTSFRAFYNPSSTAITTMAYEDQNDNLLLFADYLYIFDRKTFKFNKTIELNEGNIINSIDEDKLGNLWIGTSGNGVFKLNYNATNQSYENTNIKILDAVQSYRNSVLCSNDQVWITTQTKGLFQYDIKEESLLNFINDNSDLTTISDNTEHSLFIDRSGVLWIGTYSQGLCKIDLYKKEFLHYKSNEGNDKSLSGNAISSIHSLKTDELWVGVDLDGGVNKFVFDNDKVKQVKHYKHDPNNENTIASNSILCLVQTKKGEVWAGCTNSYVSKIIPEESGKNEHPIIKNYKLDHWTFSIIEDNQGAIWGGTWEQGLWKYDNISDKFIFFKNDPENSFSLCDNIIWALFQDNEGNIWIGGHGKGLSILPAKEINNLNPRFINFKYDEGKSNTLSNNTIHVIFQDSKGFIWIGTSGGLNKVIIKDNSFKDINSNSDVEFYSYHIKDGLPSEGITGILEDNNGNLWLSTGFGISKFNSNTKSVTNYTESDGLQSNEFCHNAYFKDQKGKMYFGGFNGINAFYPDSIKPNPFLPKIVFSDFKLFNKKVSVNEEINGDVLITKPVNYVSKINLSHKNNVFALEFAALHYAKPEKNQYAYILEGFEKDWNFVGNNREAKYTNLDPGNYTFRVKASNNDGIWNEESVSLNINVLPPWWKTWWFRLLVILFIVSMILLFFYLQLRSYRNEQKHLSKLVKVRTLELEQTNTLLIEKNTHIEEKSEELRIKNEQLDELNISKDKFFSIIAHDLKNPFSTILGLSSVIIDDDNGLTQEQQKEITRNIHSSTEKIYNLLENLLMWSSSQLNRIKITPSFYNLTNQIYKVISLLDDYATVKNIKIIFDENKEIIVYADMQMIETVVRNLITNAIKFSSDNNNIKIELLEDDDKNICSIADQGIGMTSEQITNLFKLDKVTSTEGTRGERGTGLGLNLCLDFLEKNGGTIWVKSAPNNGSTFYFSVPIKKQQ